MGSFIPPIPYSLAHFLLITDCDVIGWFSICLLIGCFVDKRRKKSSKKEKDAGYSSIEDVSRSARAKNKMLLAERDSRRSKVAQSPLHLRTYDVARGDNGSMESEIGIENEEPIYDEPACIRNNSQTKGLGDSGPIYAIYEPVESRNQESQS